MILLKALINTKSSFCFLFFTQGICVIAQLMEDLYDELNKNQFREAHDKECVTELLKFLEKQ